MAYALQSGIHISLNGTTWYKLTDHNRREIEISPTLIEKENRMANGTLRKFVTAKKDIISVSWDFLPAKSNDIVDGNYSGSWIQSFYNANYGIPVYIKIIASKHTDPTTGQVPTDSTYVSASTGEKVYNVFMTGLSKTIRKRTAVTDYIDMTLEFTEI